MDPKEELKDLADFVVDLLIDERGAKHSTSNQPQAVDPNAGLFKTDAALADALDRTSPGSDDDGPLSTGRGLRSIMQDDDPVTQVAKAATVAKTAPTPQPVREVVHNVVRERVIHERPVVTRVSEQHTNNTFLREGDQIVDNRVFNNINAQGEDIEIDLDQDIANKTVIADDGGIATGGDVKDSALNTGKVEGILAGDDVDAEDAIVGDDNTDIDDSEIGAFAEDGDATNADLDGKDDEDGPRPGTGKLPGEEHPADGKAPAADHDVLKEDVDLDREDEPAAGETETTEKAENETETDTEATTTDEDQGTTEDDAETVETGTEHSKDDESAQHPMTDASAQAEDGAPEDGTSEDRTDGQAETGGDGEKSADSSGDREESDDADGSGAERVPADETGGDDGLRADALDADGDDRLDNPNLVDADGDGVLDNPEQFDTDGDGLIDRPDLLDLDADGDADFLLRPADSFGGEDDLDLDLQN